MEEGVIGEARRDEDAGHTLASRKNPLPETGKTWSGALRLSLEVTVLTFMER